ncbi:MAG TPA: ABC transporter substrate-binding protein [Actinocrinis sp.]|nr:ABC transporter substrate-binding protein [Actinocrinis sp.]
MPHPRQEQRNAAQRTAAGRAAVVRTGRRRLGPLRCLGAVAALVLTASSVAACSSSTADALPAPDQPNIRVGVVNSIGDVPFLIGMATGGASGNGAFTKAGLNVQVTPYPTESDEINALNQGSIDIAYGEYGQFLAADDPMAKAGKIQILADAYDAGSGSIELMVRNGATLPNLTQIFDQVKNGPEIALPSETGPEYISLADYFNAQKMPISSVVGQGQEGTGNKNILVVTDPTAIMQGVHDGQYTAAVLQEPYATTAEEQYGLIPAADLATGDSAGVPLDGYFASSAFTAKYPKTVEVFDAVLSKLQNIGASRTEVEGAILASMSNPSAAVKEYVATMQLGEYPTATVPEKIGIVSQLMYNAGTISSPLNLSGLVN